MEIWNKYKKLLIALCLAVALLLSGTVLWYRREGRLLPSFGFERAVEQDSAGTDDDSSAAEKPAETMPAEEPAG